MAKAFIASVPLAIVLVAALVVPLAVIPGTFGFDRWPSSHGERVTERQVRLAPPKVDVVAVRPRSVPEPRRTFAVATVASAPAPVAAPRRAPVVRVRTAPPAANRAPRRSPPSPQNAPQAPAKPRPQPSKNDSGLLAVGDPPVARQEPTAPQPQTPVVAPAPVEHVVPQPVQHAEPSHPCHGGGEGHGGGDQGHRGHGGWQHGDGNGQD